MSQIIKRLYRTVTVVSDAGSHAVRLDDKTVKTPLGLPLALPTAALARAVAAEWDAQAEMVVPASMPLTQLASTALDRVGENREQVMSALLNYAGTDLLCYQAAQPADLAQRQAEGWRPILDWAATALDARMDVTTGLSAIPQPPEAMTALKLVLDRQDSWRLSAIQSATAAMGSLLLALALAEGRLDAEQAFALSQVDETYQMEQWGEDWEAADRRAALASDVAAAARFLDFLEPTT